MFTGYRDSCSCLAWHAYCINLVSRLFPTRGSSSGSSLPDGVMQMKRIIAFSNRKGGSGKTTTAVNVAAGLAHRGNRVLVIDTDPQAHASLSFGISGSRCKRDLYAVLTSGIGIKDAMIDTYLDNMKVVPASRRLTKFEQRWSHGNRVKP